MFRNKKLIENIEERLPEIVKLEDKFGGILSLRNKIITANLDEGSDELSLKLSDHGEYEDLLLNYSSRGKFYDPVILSQRDVVMIDGVKCFVYVRTIIEKIKSDSDIWLKNEDYIKDDSHGLQPPLTMTTVLSSVITEYNDYYTSRNQGPYKKESLPNLYSLVIGDDDIIKELSDYSDYSSFVVYDYTDDTLLNPLFRPYGYQRNAIDQRPTTHDLASIYDKVPSCNVVRRYMITPEMVLDSIKAQNASVTVNKSQRVMEELIKKFKLKNFLTSSYTDEEINEMSGKKEGNRTRFVLSKLDDDHSLLYKVERVEMRRFNSIGSTDSITTNVIVYFAFLTDSGAFVGTRNEAGYYLAKNPTKDLDTFYEYPISFDNSLDGYNEIKRLKYVDSLIQTIGVKDRIPFIINVYEEVYLESLMKGPLGIQTVMMLQTLDLQLHRSVSTRIGSYYGAVRSNQSSLPKAVGITTQQANAIKGRYGWLNNSYPFWLKKFLKPEKYEGITHDTSNQSNNIRRCPSVEKFVSITEISIEVINEVLDSLEGLFKFSERKVNQSSGELTVNKTLAKIAELDTTLNEKLKIINLFTDIYRSKVRLSKSSYITNDISHYIDYIHMVDETREELIDAGVSYSYYCPSPHLLEDRLLNMSEIYDKVKNAQFMLQFADMYENKWKEFEYSNEEYSVIAPQTPNELTYEGSALNHCVSGYKNRVVEGKTSVLFIRENKDLTKPFYTMEVNNRGKVVQVRGHSNVSPPTSVNNFARLVEDIKR